MRRPRPAAPPTAGRCPCRSSSCRLPAVLQAPGMVARGGAALVDQGDELDCRVRRDAAGHRVCRDLITCRVLFVEHRRGLAGDVARRRPEPPGLPRRSRISFFAPGVTLRICPCSARRWHRERGQPDIYVRLAAFSDASAAQLEDEIRKHIDAGSKKLILDLRGNPGGFVTAARDIASQFIASGPSTGRRTRRGPVATDAGPAASRPTRRSSSSF